MWDALHGEWQWQVDSNIIRKRRSVRFEWYKLESVSGIIDRVMTKLEKYKKMAVDGWQWHSNWQVTQQVASGSGSKWHWQLQWLNGCGSVTGSGPNDSGSGPNDSSSGSMAVYTHRITAAIGSPNTLNSPLAAPPACDSARIHSSISPESGSGNVRVVSFDRGD
jgi:hypothetical protein